MPAKQSGGGGWLVLAIACLLGGWACLSWQSELAPVVGLCCVCAASRALLRCVAVLERAEKRSRR